MIDRQAIQKAILDRAFSQNGWLTFYLMGAPDCHAAMAPSLRELKSVNLTDGVGGFVYAFVAGVDRIMDMMRTATNVTGDATVTVATASMLGEIDKSELASADDV